MNHDLSDPTLAPTSFGPFRVLHQIGVGVLGPVYRAQDGVRDQLVAVKVFKVDAPPEQAEQIADALQAVVQALPRHSGLIELIAAGVERDTAYLVMTHSDVLSLDTRLKPGVPLDAEEALGIIRTLADAMDTAHARGIVHGGLHPRDVFVDERGGCRAAGFGVATALARAGVRVPVRRPYSPPERLTSAPIEPTADRFALGAIAFELLSGRRVVGAGQAAAARCPAPVAEADVEKLHLALAAMLAEQPAHRPSTAGAFAQALTQALFPRGVSRGVGSAMAAGVAGERPAALARDERQAAGGPLAPATEPDGPSPDDLELFARQGTLWEANAKPPDAPSWDEPPRHEQRPIQWETVETVAQGADPLALFDPESPPPEPTFFAPSSDSAGANRPSPVAHAAAGAAATAAARVSGTSDDDDDEDQAFAARGGDASDTTAREHADDYDEYADERGDASERTTARPDSILGLSSVPAASASGAPAFTDVERNRADRAETEDVIDESRHETPHHAGYSHETHDVDADRDSAPFLRLDDDLHDLHEPHSALATGPATIGDEDEHDDLDGRFAQAERDRDAGAAAATAAGAAAGFAASARDGRADASRHGADDATARVRADDDIVDASATGARGWRRDHRDAPVRNRDDRDAYGTHAPRAAVPPVVAPAAARAPFASTTTPEPADVGSSVRVVGLVLALGLAVGGAGGYLLGQRSSLRAPVTDAATSDQAPGTGADPAASDAATPGSGAPGSAADARSRAPQPNASTDAAGDRAGAAAPRSTPAADASRAATGSARLTVTSSPSDAEVAINGVRRGATPLTIRNLPLGAHTVRVTRTGYAPETRRVTLAAGSPASLVEFVLAPTGRRAPGVPGASAPTAAAAPPVRGSASGLGSLYVVSRPMGAQVKVDGRFVGATPLLVTDVSTGSHTVEIQAPGHRAWSTTVLVTAGQRLRVGASLEEGAR